MARWLIRARPHRPVIVLCMAYVMLAFAWLLSTPPGGAPDEPAGLIKAMALAGGDVVGSTVVWPDPARNVVEQQYRDVTRRADVPANLRPDRQIPCYAFDPDASAVCLGDESTTDPRWSADPAQRLATAPDDLAATIGRLEVGTGSDGRPQLVGTSYIGTYQPFVFLPAGVLARLAESPEEAAYLGRIGNLMLSSTLLILGLLLLWDARCPAVLIGGLAAVTPMTLFLCGTLSSSGPEIAAGICVVAGILRVSRGVPPGPWIWSAIGAGGVVLASARALGPIWIVAATAFAVTLLGRHEAWRLARHGGRGAAAACTATAVATVVGLAWQLVVQPGAGLSLRDIPGYLAAASRELSTYYGEMIGNFGWLSQPLPPWGLWAWAGVLGVMIVIGVALGAARERVVLVGALVAAVALSIVISAVVGYPLYSRLQGRWVLPFAVAVPLTAGHVLRRIEARRHLVLAGVGLVVVAVTTAAAQGAGLWMSARRHAVGRAGPLQFLGRSEWVPPGGWAPTLVVGLVGLGLMVAAAADAAWRLVHDPRVEGAGHANASASQCSDR